MSYEDGEELIKRRVQACPNFNSKVVGRANWKLLNTGKSGKGNYAILRPGPFNIEWLSPTMFQTNWTTVVELWQRYTNDVDTKTALYERVADLLGGMHVYKRLADTTGNILSFTMRSGGEVQEMWRSGGGPQWLKWELACEWREKSVVTYSD